jgi:hypothetical protein
MSSSPQTAALFPWFTDEEMATLATRATQVPMKDRAALHRMEKASRILAAWTDDLVRDMETNPPDVETLEEIARRVRTIKNDLMKALGIEGEPGNPTSPG